MNPSTNKAHEGMAPTLGQLAALSLTYKLLFKTLQLIPLAFLILPILINASNVIIGGLTKNHTIVSIAMTAALTSMIRAMILSSAPSRARGVADLEKIEITLPLVMFIVSAIAIHLIVAPIESALGISGLLTWTLSISIGDSLRLAAFSFVLNLSVILRYVGPPSVMRCSSSPLFAHPLYVSLQNLITNLNTEAFLDLLAGPNNAVKVATRPTHSNKAQPYRIAARRMQNPMLKAVLAQIATNTVLGIVAAYVAVLPYLSNSTGNDTPLKAAIISTCIIAKLTHTMQSSLSGNAHELNPTLYWNKKTLSSSNTKVPDLTLAALAPFLLVLVGAVLIQMYLFNPTSQQRGSLAHAVPLALLVGVVIYGYLEGFDQALRYMLCRQSTHFEAEIAWALGDDRLPAFLEVALHSIMHAHTPLVTDLLKPAESRYHDIERDEVRRHNKAMKEVGTILLEKPAIDYTVGCLEEDYLRIAILSSLAGDLGKPVSETSQNKSLMKWIQPTALDRSLATRGPPLVMPLVRALCAYTGGLGEATTKACSEMRRTRTNPWKLPPGAIVCATYCIRAAARLILADLQVSAKNNIDWKSTQISMIIPVFLVSSYQLRRGLEIMAGAPPQTIVPFGMINSQSLRRNEPEYLLVCDELLESSKTILDTLQSLKGLQVVSLSVDRDCSSWMSALVLDKPMLQG